VLIARTDMPQVSAEVDWILKVLSAQSALWTTIARCRGDSLVFKGPNGLQGGRPAHREAYVN